MESLLNNVSRSLSTGNNFKVRGTPLLGKEQPGMEKRNWNWPLLLHSTYLPVLLTLLFRYCLGCRIYPRNTKKVICPVRMQIVSVFTGAYFVSS